MKLKLLIISLLLASGCANTAKYQPRNWYDGGYSEQQISEKTYKISYSGNNSDLLTIQTYWLYRAAEFALEKGANGFEILTPLPTDKPEGDTSYRVACPSLDLVCTTHFRTPWIDAYASIQLINGEVSPVARKIFNAHALKSKLSPVIGGGNCGDPNPVFGTSKVCPHNMSYLDARD